MTSPQDAGRVTVTEAEVDYVAPQTITIGGHTLKFFGDEMGASGEWYHYRARLSQQQIEALEAAVRPDDDAKAEVERLTPAARDVLAERRRHYTVEGWNEAFEDQKEDGLIAQAARGYLRLACSNCNFDTVHWPFLGCQHPVNKREALVRGVALGLAEIERLDRAAALATRRPGSGDEADGADTSRAGGGHGG